MQEDPYPCNDRRRAKRGGAVDVDEEESLVAPELWWAKTTPG